MKIKNDIESALSGGAQLLRDAMASSAATLRDERTELPDYVKAARDFVAAYDARARVLDQLDQVRQALAEERRAEGEVTS